MFYLIPRRDGGFRFAGRVPFPLAFDYENEADLDAALVIGQGPAQRRAEAAGRVFRPRAYETADAAFLAALAHVGDPTKLALSTRDAS